MIEIQSQVPPRIFCPESVRERGACNILVKGSLKASKEKKCLNGLEIVQAVFQQQDERPLLADACGTQVSPKSWNSIHTISVKATVDSLYDKTQLRSIQISLLIRSKYFVISTVKIDRVKVSTSGIFNSIQSLFQNI